MNLLDVTSTGHSIPQGTRAGSPDTRMYTKSRMYIILSNVHQSDNFVCDIDGIHGRWRQNVHIKALNNTELHIKHFTIRNTLCRVSVFCGGLYAKCPYTVLGYKKNEGGVARVSRGYIKRRRISYDIRGSGVRAAAEPPSFTCTGTVWKFGSGANITQFYSPALARCRFSA